jgi:type II secretory pathway component PulC
MKDLIKSLLTRRTLATAGVIAAVSILLAWGASVQVERLLALPEGADLAEVERLESAEGGDRLASSRNVTRARARTRNSDYYLDPIVQRNIFDPDAVRGEVVTEDEGERSDLPFRVLATVVSDPSQFSTAIIGNERGDNPLVYTLTQCPGSAISTKARPCSRLTDDAVIVGIEWRKVRIEREDGSIEYLDIGGDDGERPRTSTRETEESVSGIEEAGTDHYTVERSVIDNALDDLDALANQVRVRPHRDSDGEVDGFRLSGIRRGSMLEQLGIKNGDIIHEVNGYPLNSNSGAMTAFQSLQSESNFTFDITRRNRRKNMTYDVR